MKLTHWVNKEYVGKVLSGKGLVSDNGIAYKPNGIWLSVDGGWESWCRTEMPGWIGKGKVCLGAKLKDGINIWKIDCKEDFDKEWDIRFWSEGSRALIRREYEKFRLFWKHICEKYDGIYITEKAFWEMRLDNMFAYSCDCSCIVVFDARNVIFFEERDMNGNC